MSAYFFFPIFFISQQAFRREEYVKVCFQIGTDDVGGNHAVAGGKAVAISVMNNYMPAFD
ncbi:hypothetical protein AB9R16_00020 [Neisseria gonorrhoeae]